MANVFSPATLAERWGCSAQSILRLIGEGSLVAFKVGNGIYCVREEEVAAYELRGPGPPATYEGSFVYFIRCGDFVKIGVANDVAARISALQRTCPYPLELLATEPGHIPQERVLHAKFADCRHQHEWFRLSPEIQAYIDELQNAAR